MNQVLDSLTINGVEYARRDSVKSVPEVTDDYVIVRTTSAGVFAGHLHSRVGKEVTLTNARRLWKWVGAASLSQLAMEGVSKPNECRFPTPVTSILLTEAIEVIGCTLKAKESIEGVPVWKA